jgi:hypothetical protein
MVDELMGAQVLRDFVVEREIWLFTVTAVFLATNSVVPCYSLPTDLSIPNRK